jgi:ribosomal protein S3
MIKILLNIIEMANLLKKSKMNLTNNYNKNYLLTNQLSTYYNGRQNGVRGQVSTLNSTRIRTKLIKAFFRPIERLGSKPIFTITRDRVIINVFYYTTEGALNNNRINNLGEVLSKVFNRKVQLEFIKLSYPHLSRDILAQYLRINAEGSGFRKIKKLLFKKANITRNARSQESEDLRLPSHIIGIKVQVSGRLERERSRPRKTVSTAQVGPIRGKDKLTLVDYGSYTSKNTKGAYTVKVWVRQKVSPPTVSQNLYLIILIYI